MTRWLIIGGLWLAVILYNKFFNDPDEFGCLDGISYLFNLMFSIIAGLFLTVIALIFF